MSLAHAQYTCLAALQFSMYGHYLLSCALQAALGEAVPHPSAPLALPGLPARAAASAASTMTMVNQHSVLHASPA